MMANHIAVEEISTGRAQSGLPARDMRFLFLAGSPIRLHYMPLSILFNSLFASRVIAAPFDARIYRNLEAGEEANFNHSRGLLCPIPRGGRPRPQYFLSRHSAAKGPYPEGEKNRWREGILQEWFPYTRRLHLALPSW